MTGTWRREFVYTYDGFEHTRRRAKTRSQMKPVDRRIKRREHHAIVAEAVHSYYTDAADDLYEFHLMEAEEQWSEYLDYLADEDYYDDYYEDPYEYDDPFDYGVSAYDWDDDYEPIEHTLVRPQDVGRSLGDILQEILTIKS